MSYNRVGTEEAHGCNAETYWRKSLLHMLWVWWAAQVFTNACLERRKTLPLCARQYCSGSPLSRTLSM